MRSDNAPGSLAYCINVSHSYVNRREYRQEVSIFSCLSYKAGTSSYLIVQLYEPAIVFHHKLCMA